MAAIYVGEVDLLLIDKSKINEFVRRNGKKGAGLKITISINDTTDEYKNIGSISISQSKEERERGEKKVYLGNIKQTWTSVKPAYEGLKDQMSETEKVNAPTPEEQAAITVQVNEAMSNNALDDLPF